MSCESYGGGGMNNSFVLIVVLFILLIIVGASFMESWILIPPSSVSNENEFKNLIPRM